MFDIGDRAYIKDEKDIYDYLEEGTIIDITDDGLYLIRLDDGSACYVEEEALGKRV
jgi:hypothetical protein